MTTRPTLPQGYRNQSSLLAPISSIGDWNVDGNGVISLIESDHGAAIQCITSSQVDIWKSIDVNFGQAPWLGFWLWVSSVVNLSSVSSGVDENVAPPFLIGNREGVFTSTGIAAYITAQKFVAEKSGTCNYIVVQSAGNTNIKVGIYADSSDYPGARLAYSNGTAITAGTTAISLVAPVSLVGGTTYWLAMVTDRDGAMSRTNFAVDNLNCKTYNKSSSYAKGMVTTFPSAADRGYKRDWAMGGYSASPAFHFKSSTRITSTGYTFGTQTDYGIQEGWNFISIPPSVYNSTPGSWSNAQKRFIVRVCPIPGRSVTVKVCPAYQVDRAIPTVLFDFDNGYDSVLDVAYPILEAAGFKASTGVNSAYVGHAGVGGGAQHLTLSRMTEADLEELYEAGWDLNNHTETHAGGDGLRSLTYAQNLTEIGNCQSWLEERGFTRGSRHLVFPSGTFSAANTFPAMTVCGVLSARLWGLNEYSKCGYATFPVWSLGCITPHDYTSGMTVAQTCAAIDESVAAGGSIAICFHNISDTIVTNYDMSIANFQAIVNHVASKRVRVVTRSELYEGFVNPRYRSLPVGRT